MEKFKNKHLVGKVGVLGLILAALAVLVAIIGTILTTAFEVENGCIVDITAYSYSFGALVGMGSGYLNKLDSKKELLKLKEELKEVRYIETKTVDKYNDLIKEFENISREKVVGHVKKVKEPVDKEVLKKERLSKELEVLLGELKTKLGKKLSEQEVANAIAKTTAALQHIENLEEKIALVRTKIKKAK